MEGFYWQGRIREVTMESTSLVLAAVEWGREAVAAAKNKTQQRSANILERAALLAAGMRYLDRRYGELFIPLTFYDERSWPLEKRQQHAQEMIAFIFNDRVVSDMSQAISWLMNSPADDMYARTLVENLVEVTSAALGGGRDQVDPDRLVAELDERTHPTRRTARLLATRRRRRDGAAGGPGKARWRAGARSAIWSRDMRDLPTTWADQVRWMIDPAAGPDSIAAPLVVYLVELLRADAPDPEEVRQAARQCLFAPAKLGPLMVEPGGLPRYVDGLELPPTVSPLQQFADIVGARFQELLACMQVSFPGIPTPSWVYSA